jgi:squalene synthase HpnC
MNTIEPAARAMTLDDAFAYCERITRGHYENFPVGSALVPKELRRHFYSIYAYSRAADDIADEGERPAGERIAMLDDWERRLEGAYRGDAAHPVFIALAATVRERSIPIEPLRDLLKAFRRDALNEGFATDDDLLAYCNHSANPVGRLVLHLFGYHDERRGVLSDAICTALQLANFWQDISVDVPRGRINLPRETMERHGYSLQELRDGVFNEAFREMMAWSVERAEELFERGHPLIASIPSRRLRAELGLVHLGGTRILGKIRRGGYDVMTKRPSLGLADKLAMMFRLIWS